MNFYVLAKSEKVFGLWLSRVTLALDQIAAGPMVTLMASGATFYI